MANIRLYILTEVILDTYYHFIKSKLGLFYGKTYDIKL